MAAPDTGSAQDAGPTTPGVAPGNADVQDLLVVHDLHADSLNAAVVYAHDVKAKEAHYDNLVIIADSDLPRPGEQDVHSGGSVTANEVHAHHVDVKLLQAGTVYVVKKPK